MIQVIVFVALVFAIPWIVGPWLPQQPQNRWEVIASYVPGVWAPTLIAIAMIARTDGRSGLRRELTIRFRFAAGDGGWLLVAIVAPALVTLAGVLGARLTGSGQPFIPALAVGALLFFSQGEVHTKGDVISVGHGYSG